MGPRGAFRMGLLQVPVMQPVILSEAKNPLLGPREKQILRVAQNDSL
jgi:hypothetical protein